MEERRKAMLRAQAKELYEAAKIVEPITNERSGLPILSHILIEGNGHTELTATNLQTAIRVTLPFQADTDIATTLPGRMFRDVLANASGEVTIEEGENNRIKIEDGSGSREIATMDPTDYPAWGKLDGLTTAASLSQFIKDITKVMNCASTDESRFRLDNVFFDGPKARIVATDGHKLAKLSVDWIPIDQAALVPLKGLKHVVRSFKAVQKRTDDLQVTWGEKGLSFTADIVTIMVRTGEGDYPEVDKFDQKDPVQAILDAKELTKAIKLVSKSGGKMVEVLFADDGCVLYCLEPLHGDTGQTWIPAKYPGALPCDVRLDLSLFLQATRKCKDQAVLSTDGPGSHIMVGDQIVTQSKAGGFTELGRETLKSEYSGKVKITTPALPTVKARAKKPRTVKKVKSVKAAKVDNHEKHNPDAGLELTHYWRKGYSYDRTLKSGEVKTITVKAQWIARRVK